MPMVIKALQELSEKNKKLEQRIEELEKIIYYFNFFSLFIYLHKNKYL